MWLEEDENDLLLCHRGSFPRNVSGQVELTWWTLGIMTRVVRLFLGQTWLPMRMGAPAQGEVRVVAGGTSGFGYSICDSCSR